MKETTKPDLAVLNRGHPIVHGLVLDLPFTERSGLKVREATGLMQKDFTYDSFSDDDWVMTPHGAAMDFGTGEGAGRRLWFDPTTLADNKLDMLDGITVEGIWRFTNSNQFGFLVSYYDGVSGYRKYNITRNSASLEIRITMSDDSTLDLSHGGMATNTWMHTFMTYDRKYGRTYLNGILKVETASTLAIKTAGSIDEFSIGADRGSWTGGDLYGEIALCRIWNRGLNQQEVSKLTADPWILYRRQTFTLPNVDLFGKLGGITAIPHIFGDEGMIVGNV